MKILVTGGLGTIGTHLVWRLRASEHDVLCTDIAVHTDDVQYMRVDVAEYEDVLRAFTFDPDLVLHAAGEVGIDNGEEHPARMLQINCAGALNVSRLCSRQRNDRKADPTRLIYFSTSEVYGKISENPTDCPGKGDLIETARLSLSDVTNVYAISKLVGEQITLHYQPSCTVVRPFMVYGPGEPVSAYRSAIVNFIVKALQNEPLVVHKGATRAWCYIDDFIDGLMLLIEQQHSGIYNIGARPENAVSMFDIANLIVVITKSQSPIWVIDPDDDLAKTRTRMMHKVASIRKMQDLGYAPSMPLQTGIKYVIEYVQAIFDQQ